VREHNSKQKKTMKTENTIEVALPFCGFYESALSYEIDRELESIFDPECGYGDVPDEIYNQIDYGKVHQSLASAYVKAFENWLANEHGIEMDLDFVEMTSPREYNFSTDRVFVNCLIPDLEKVFNAVKDEMPEMVKKRFTSGPGFISFYDSDFDKWPESLADWDHNEAETLFECLFHGEFQDATYAILEWMTGNGEVSDAIYEAATPEGVALMDKAYSEYMATA
jgi:hypothetical protein